MFITRRRYSRGRLAKRRARAFLLNVIGVVLAAAAVLSVASFLFSRDAIAITAVSVEGERDVSADMLRELVFRHLEGSYFLLFPKDSVFLYPRRAIEREVLDAFPRVKEADVRFEDFHTVVLRIVEREPFALWCNDLDACHLLDATGFIYSKLEAVGPLKEKSVRFYGTLPREALSTEPIGTQFLPQRAFRDLSLFYRTLAHDLGLSATAVTIIDEHDFEIALENGVRLVARRDADFSRVLSAALAVFRSEELSDSLDRLDYADFRFGNKVYYKWR